MWVMLFFVELLCVNVVNLVKYMRIVLKLIWVYMNFRKEMDFFLMKVIDYKMERNCIGCN